MSIRDFALSRRKDDWLQHPVLGDPSFDSFRRRQGNPICRGKGCLEWPVNGFLFEDPPTGHWYVYVGHYARHYAMGLDKSSVCTVSRSVNRGKTWEHLGPVFPQESFLFSGLS